MAAAKAMGLLQAKPKEGSASSSSASAVAHQSASASSASAAPPEGYLYAAGPVPNSFVKIPVDRLSILSFISPTPAGSGASPPSTTGAGTAGVNLTSASSSTNVPVQEAERGRSPRSTTAAVGRHRETQTYGMSSIYVSENRAQFATREHMTCRCGTCGALWTIDSLDRDWHTDKMWCSICDVKLEQDSDEPDDEDDHQPWDDQGRSLSEQDGGSSEDGENSDDDHLASACPAIHHEEDWDDWEDVVEEFKRSLPKSVAAAAASTLDRGQSAIIDKHMENIWHQQCRPSNQIDDLIVKS
jgi:hypothetical protein